jgi:hypothetical protein
MDANPFDVVVLLLLNINGISAVELAAEYSKDDLAHYGYVPRVIDEAPPHFPGLTKPGLALTK